MTKMTHRLAFDQRLKTFRVLIQEFVAVLKQSGHECLLSFRAMDPTDRFGTVRREADRLEIEMRPVIARWFNVAVACALPLEVLDLLAIAMIGTSRLVTNGGVSWTW